MNMFTLAVIFVVLQAASPVPRQATDKPNANGQPVQKNAATNQNPSASVLPPQNAIEPQTQQGQTEKPHDSHEQITVVIQQPTSGWEKAYVVLTGLLAIIGMFGVAAAFRTLKAVEAQAAIMRGQIAEMKSAGSQTAELIKHAAAQAAALTVAAQAAQKSAEAALANAVAAKQAVEIVISKERCRISIAVNLLHLVYHRNSATEEVSFRAEDAQGVGYDIHIYGLTEGHILEGTARSCISDSQEPPDLPAFPMRGLPSRVMFRPDEPESGYQGGFVQMLPRMESLEDMFDVVEGRKFIHFWGVIRYRDVFFDAFRQERKTAFRRVWRFTENAATGTAVFTPLGGRFGRWFECGPAEDNQET